MEMPLTQLGIGKTATVKGIEGGFSFRGRILSLGIRIGKKIRVMSTHPMGGPLVVEIDGMMIAIGRGMAHKIIVELK